MKLTVLGSGTHLPDPDRGAPGFLVQHDHSSILVDGGSGTLQRLARAGVDPAALDAGVYTHRHLDHLADLAPLLFTMRCQQSPARLRDYPIFAGTGFAAYLEQLRQLYPGWIEPEHFDVRVHELPLDGPGRTSLPGGLKLDTLPAHHPQGALHLRFTTSAGRMVAFSGDTGPSEALERLAAGVDLLVCECAVPPDATIPHHLTAREVAEIVAASRPRRVVLHHLYPRHDPAADVAIVARTGVPTSWAVDGQVFVLP